MPIRLSGMVSGMDTESMVTELMRAQRLKTRKIENKITTTEWKQEKWKALNTKIYSFYTGELSKLRMQGSFNTKKVTSTNENVVSVTANTSAPDGSHSLIVKQLASSQFVTGAKLGKDDNNKDITSSTKLVDLGMTAGEGNTFTVTNGSKTKTLEITDTTTVGDYVKMLKDAGLNASFDSTQKRIFISSKESGLDNAFTLSQTGTADLTKLGLHTISKTVENGKVTLAGGGDMTLVSPADAIIQYNGAEITSSSNTISINGLTLTLKGLSPNNGTETINLNVTKDTQAIFDMVKNFVKKYNELLTEMNAAYSAEKADGYEPLSDDEKAAMTDDQIDKWETKIKDALLRRDSNLGNLINMMRSTMSESVEYEGKKYSLSSLGIASANYTEKGFLHINGDTEDSLVSGLSNDLMKVLNEDPDKAMTILNGLADKLYKSLNENMKSSSLRSALTLYNDKEMTKSITDNKERLKQLEKKLTDMENKYYKQFSAMETAMSKLNSQSNQLASMLGMNRY